MSNELLQRCEAMIRLVEGFPAHEWRSASGQRIKDTDDWVKFYVTTNDAIAAARKAASQQTVAVTMFPRQPNGAGGWTIDEHYISAIRKDCEVEWRPGEEEIEAVLLAVERAAPATPAAEVAVPDEIETLRKDVTTALDVLAKRTKECEEWKAAAGRFDANNIELRARIKELEAAQTTAVPDDHTKEPPYDLAVWVLSRLVDSLKERFGDNFPDCDGDDVESNVLNGIVAFIDELSSPATPAVEVPDERKAAEHAYVISAFDYAEAPVGSRDWTLFWSGWQKRAALSAPATPAKVEDDVARDAARLDFLISEGAIVASFVMKGRTPSYWLCWHADDSVQVDTYASPREAIDAAMLSAAQAKEAHRG